MNKESSEKNIFLLITSLWKYLSKVRRRQIKSLILLVIISSIAEFTSIYSLVPFLEVLSIFLKYFYFVDICFKSYR